jgi:hypothetical protein
MMPSLAGDLRPIIGSLTAMFDVREGIDVPVPSADLSVSPSLQFMERLPPGISLRSPTARRWSECDNKFTVVSMNYRTNRL